MKNAFITGGSSFVGRSLINRLARDYDTIYTLIRRDSPNRRLVDFNGNIVVLEGDISDIKDAVKNCPPCDAFFHLAWSGAGPEGRDNLHIQEQNIENSLKCLEAAESLACKTFLFSGSQAEYGRVNGKIHEETPCDPENEYGKAKLLFYSLAKKYLSRLDIKYIHGRIFSVYGAGDHDWTLVSSCVKSAINNEKLRLSSCTQNWNFLHVADCAEAFVKLSNTELNDNDSGIFNIASQTTRQLKRYVEEIFRIAGLPASVEFGDTPGISLDPCVDKLITAGWRENYNFEQGISEIYKTYSEKIQ